MCVCVSVSHSFYPTALKGCWGIVVTHGVRIGRRREEVGLARVSETVRCRKLILGRDIRTLGDVGMQCHGVTLI